jgi:hypothetical protein
MKHIYHILTFLLFIACLIFYSCKKERSCEGCQTNQSTVNTNKPPIALAGTDQTVNLPTDNILLDGSASNDPDNNISNYLWTKISGPASFNIVNANTSQTQVSNLIEGIYQFELKVTDAGGLVAKDTVNITVTQPITDAMNIYVAGQGGGEAQYWKNSQAVNLPNGTIANSIFVSGNDLYVAGQEYLGGGIHQIARYWKNSIAVNLTNGISYAGANDIYVSGNDTYVAGWESVGNAHAKYWKNGIAVSLSNGTQAKSIFVSGNDVYVAGDNNGTAKYWKNGIEVSLSNQTINSTWAQSIVVVPR